MTEAYRDIIDCQRFALNMSIMLRPRLSLPENTAKSWQSKKSEKKSIMQTGIL